MEQEMDLMNLRMFSGLSVRTIVKLTRNSDVLDYVMDHAFCPQEHIIDKFLPQSIVEIPNEPNICVLDP
ncbi:hypothetical protein RHMOL_Rhmol01G0145500 [Rhododendron molle]|uniref:Uncharacterized protein n=1 Tax=Rhododendron molle TaxID=49168 RepID=A0ACC0Q3D9_RHOML|nr:hypothetical protein RHMOL_Rhmol01G0145500 [Rhododendron molle]